MKAEKTVIIEVVEKSVPGVDLKGLTPLEAEVLMDLCNSVSGVRSGPRGITDRIAVALHMAGVAHRRYTTGSVQMPDSFVERARL